MSTNDITSEKTTEVSPINTVRRVVSDFSKTAKYKEILKHVEFEIFQILFCHGFAGTGKSSIVQKLAEEFPYCDDGQAVKYHIECDNQGQDFKEKLVKMLDLMKRNHHVNEIKEHAVLAEMEKNKADTLVQVLSKCESSILVIIEDIKPHDYTFLSSFLENLESKTSASSKIHVYITARQEKLQVSESMESKIFSVKITGFTLEEGMRYLINGDNTSTENRQAAREVVNRFSAAPLGLKAAKEFCKVESINYVQYMEYILEDSDYVSGTEAELIDQHIYQAITLPFTMKGRKHVEQDWWILTCLSFLYHYEIPFFVITSLCHLYQSLKNGKGMPGWQAMSECKRLIRELTLYHLCTQSLDDNGECIAISFHEVVLNSFRFWQSKEFPPLDGAVSALASLSTKDLREKEAEIRMVKLIPHLHSLLSHCQNLKLFEGTTFNREWMLNNLVLSNLYEVLGAIGLQHEKSEKCEQYLEIALDKILKIIQFLCKDAKPLCIKAMEITDENVSKINDACLTAGRKLPDGFIAEFESKVVAFPSKGEQNFLRKKSKNVEEFDAVCKESGKGSGVLLPKYIETFRKCDIYLDEDTHKNVFFSERVAMLLHSMSRVPVFNDSFNTFDHIEKYTLYSDCAYRIALGCKPHASLLMEYLARTGGFISLMLKCKDNSGHRELVEAKEYCLKSFMSMPLMYEHGFVRECENEMGKMQLLRFVVRINVRLMNGHNDEETSTNDEYCRKLAELADDNPCAGMAATCYVYCAKYFAKKKDVTTAYQYFDKFFRLEMVNHKTVAWAAFNYARAVFYSRNEDGCRINNAISGCEQVLQDFVIRNPKLIKFLEEYLKKLLDLKHGLEMPRP